MITESLRAYKCAVCGKISRHPIVQCTKVLGARDLDTRPPETFRLTMNAWVQECPHCGYVASKLSDRSQLAQEVMETESYQTCDGVPFPSELGARFYRLYLIKRRERDYLNAFWSALEAAWDADDHAAFEVATKLRNLALEQLDKLLAEKPKEESLQLIRVDVLRRASQFETAESYAQTLSFTDSFLQTLANAEIKLARERDSKCYKITDVVKTEEYEKAEQVEKAKRIEKTGE